MEGPSFATLYRPLLITLLAGLLFCPSYRVQAEEPSTKAAEDIPHANAFSVHPQPIPRAPLELNPHALNEHIHMWFPSFDGDGFFAVFDKDDTSSVEPIEAGAVFQLRLQPILESLGFPAILSLLQSEFAIPQHSGISLGRPNFSKLASRACSEWEVEEQPKMAQAFNRTSRLVDQLHLVHSGPLVSTKAEGWESTADAADSAALAPSIKEWNKWWCRVFQETADKERLALLEKNESVLSEALNSAFQQRTDQTFKQYVEDFEREDRFYFFPQIHIPERDEFSKELALPRSVAIDHAGIRADWRERQGIYSATGRVFVSPQITNRVMRCKAEAVEAAVRELNKLKVVVTKTVPLDRVSLVLLPYGSGLKDGAKVPALRYAYRMPVSVKSDGKKRLLYLWLDAAEDNFLEIVPLSSSAAQAVGVTLHLDPGGLPTGLDTISFNIDEPVIQPTPTCINPGVTCTDVTLVVTGELQGEMPDGSAFIVNQPVPNPGSPWDFTSPRPTAASTTNGVERWEKLDAFATVFRYMDTAKSASLTFAANYPLLVRLLPDSSYYSVCEHGDLASQDEVYLKFNSYNPQDCFPSEAPSIGKTYNDHTLVAHEMGHLLTKRQYGYYPADPALSPRSGMGETWCQNSVFPSDPNQVECPLPMSARYVHDFADAWVQVLEDTNCVGGWMGQWIAWKTWSQTFSYSDKSRGCTKHHEGGGWPRLSAVPDPVGFDYQFAAWPYANTLPSLWDSSWTDALGNTWGSNSDFAQKIGDHFPEHRKVRYTPEGTVPEYADMQIAAAALWEARQGAISLSHAGRLQYLTRFVRTLATTGWLGLESLSNSCIDGTTTPKCLRGPYADRDVYRGLVDLEVKLANQWTSETSTNSAKIDRSVNKVAAGFARAGIFMIHPNCIDKDSTNNNDVCPQGESGGDAVIDVTDNDSTDDWVTADGIVHEERDWLRPGLPVPGFHLWTGPRYVFSENQASSGGGEPPLCNNMFRIQLAEDENFTEILATSGWLETSSLRPCYCKWSLPLADWFEITLKLEAHHKDRIYYRAVTCTVPPGSGTPCLSKLQLYRGPVEYPNPAASHVRWSTKPANGLFGYVQPPYAIVNQWGTYPPAVIRALEAHPERLPFNVPPPPQEPPTPRPRWPGPPPPGPLVPLP